MKKLLAVIAVVAGVAFVAPAAAQADLSYAACRQGLVGTPGDDDITAESNYLGSLGHNRTATPTWDGASRAGDWTIDQWVKFYTDDGQESDHFRCHDSDHDGVVGSAGDWLVSRGVLAWYV